MTRKSQDSQLEHALEDWARQMVIPETPNIAPRVRKILESSRQRRFQFGLPRMQLPAVALAGIAAVVVIGLGLGLAWQARSSKQKVVMMPTAVTILGRAASRLPAMGRVVHLTYQIQPVNGHARTLNVWEKVHHGRILSLERYQGPGVKLGLAFVSEPGMIRRTWISRPGLSSEQLARLVTSPPARQVGSLEASLLLQEVGSGLARARFTGVRSIDHHKAYRVLVSYGNRHPPAVLYFDPRSYTLLRQDASNHAERLVQATTLSTRQSPDFVVAHLAQNYQSGSAAGYGSTAAY